MSALSCPHGSLARSCEVCELTELWADACHGWANAEVERDEAIRKQSRTRSEWDKTFIKQHAAEAQRDAARALLRECRAWLWESGPRPLITRIDKALSEGEGGGV